ncbi:MAG TPA: four helix bundle protein [Chitinophagaceae bacterium]
MSYQTFEDLEVWKKARVLKNEIKELTTSFPPDEKYRLTDQLIRSSRSINSQIAEGHGRRTTKERIQFCIIARGSLSETLNHLIDAFDCNYIGIEILNEFKSKIIEIERMLNGYISYLTNKLKSE